MRWLLLALTIAFSPAHADEALWQAVRGGKDNLVLVSHGSTALALTGEHPGMGEILVLKPESQGFRVVGRLSLP